MLAPARLGMPDPIARISFAFTQFVEKAIADPVWRASSAKARRLRTEFARSVRENLKADLAEA